MKNPQRKAHIMGICKHDKQHVLKLLILNNKHINYNL